MAPSKNSTNKGWLQAWGILLIALCLFVILSLFSYNWKDIRYLCNPPNSPPFNLIGPLGAWLSYILFMTFGISAYSIPFLLLALGVILIVKNEDRVWPRIVWAAVLLVALAMLLDLRHTHWTDQCRKLNIFDLSGGFLGRLLAGQLLVNVLGPIGTGALAGCAIVVAAIFLPGVEVIVVVYKNIATFCVFLYGKLHSMIDEHQDDRMRLEKEERKVERQRKKLERAVAKKEKPTLQGQPPIDAPAKPVKSVKELLGIGKKKAEARKAPKATVAAPEPTTGFYNLPPLSLLDQVPPPKDRAIKSDVKTTSRILQETLAEFGIEAEVTNVEGGPVVTRYELLPAPGVRVERIAGLGNNIALSLKATSVRVQAPVPGKGVVGIEVPNATSSMVYLREVLESEDWQSHKAHLPLALGKDVGGNDLVADLAAMPHMLVAGATGAGKTVCMNSLLAGLLMSRSPGELRLMLIDPKIVEFSVYNHIPHLIAPVITDPKKVVFGLRWAITEMEKRYKLFAKAGVRNIESYNNRPVEQQTDLFQDNSQEEPGDSKFPAKVPYIVIVIDELADLMLVAQADIENSIARLAQLSRAVGIHMIISTQRPSVNVITGTIKANFPARIAFQVAQKVDSRTILDANGAEKLLGRGDMLFQPPGTSKLIRAQGAMCTDAEIKRVVDFVKEQAQPAYEIEVKQKIESKGQPMDDEYEDEDILVKATEIIRETQRASTSSLQRRLRIGYTRAARVMDILEERGIVGPPRGSEPREILIDLDSQIPDNPESVEE